MIATAISIQQETERALTFPLIQKIAGHIVDNHNSFDNEELIEHLFILAKVTAGTTAGFVSHLLMGDDFEKMVEEMKEFDELSESIVEQELNNDNS